MPGFLLRRDSYRSDFDREVPQSKDIDAVVSRLGLDVLGGHVAGTPEKCSVRVRAFPSTSRAMPKSMSWVTIF